MAVSEMQCVIVLCAHLMSSVAGQVFPCVLVGGQGALASRLSCKAHFLPTSLSLFTIRGFLEFDSEARSSLVGRCGTILHAARYF
jgi:hypothetical protein